MKDQFIVRFILKICLIVLILFSVAHSQENAEGGINLSHVWARATPLGSKVGVVYLQISIKRGGPDTLLSVSSPIAAKVEIHTHILEDGILKMRRLDTLPLTEGEKVLFEPAGLHLMLIDLKEQLKLGKTFPLTFLFEKAGEIKVEAKIEPIGSQGEVKNKI